jgi:membrane-bound lytic murein transglycosylase D
MKAETAESAAEKTATDEIEIDVVAEETKPTSASQPKAEPVMLASNSSSATAEAVRSTPTIVQKTNVIMPVPENGEILVALGMTWYQISRHYKKNLDSLMTWNSGISRELKLGQKIRVEKVATLKPAAIPAETKSVAPVNRTESFDLYEVKTGDSSYSIARKFGMKIDRFLQINQKEDAALRVGDQVKVDRVK